MLENVISLTLTLHYLVILELLKPYLRVLSENSPWDVFLENGCSYIEKIKKEKTIGVSKIIWKIFLREFILEVLGLQTTKY